MYNITTILLANENTKPFHFKVISDSYLLNEKDI